MSGERIVIVDGARTPVGKYAGALKSVPAHELGAIASVAALERSGIGKDEIDEVIFGCAGQVGPDAYNARRVALAAGLPDSTPAFTVNRLCGSGLQAIWSAAQQLRWGGAEVILAGGDESMSRIPFLDFEARGNPRLGNRTLVDGTVSILTDPFIDMHMGFTAENVE
ncbi:MAG TPA: beta-ketoacyl synthase N-terminal-like domain-containing protein, partial [Dermatophilaceae bacterium]